VADRVTLWTCGQYQSIYLVYADKVLISGLIENRCRATDLNRYTVKSNLVVKAVQGVKYFKGYSCSTCEHGGLIFLTTSSKVMKTHTASLARRQFVLPDVWRWV
jgi:hypothetical protein